MLFALVCAAVAIAYGLALTIWLLRQPDGNERMREIARVEEGATLEEIYAEQVRAGEPIS